MSLTYPEYPAHMTPQERGLFLAGWVDVEVEKAVAEMAKELGTAEAKVRDSAHILWFRKHLEADVCLSWHARRLAALEAEVARIKGGG